MSPLDTVARFVRRSLPLLILLLVASCGHRRPTDLDTLVRQDSLYLIPGTLKPFSGPVVRYFKDDPGKVQIEATLKEGMWEGEMTVYHESGRIRYQGRLSRGAPCGAWVNNRDDEPAGSALIELTRDIASLGMYPECPEK